MATEEDHRSMNRRNKRFKWSPIPSPKHDFEYPLPKFGGESSYVHNLGYDVDRKPYLQCPHEGSTPEVSGVFVPVNKLLFTSERDFLIDNSGHKFHAAHLQDKILAILTLSIDPLPLKDRTQTDRYVGALKAAYTELRSSNCSFEVVFVALDDAIEGEGGHNQEYFDALFQRMPWLAIPYSDTHSRNFCIEYFDCDLPVSCILLQTNGYILHDWPAIFTIYGAKAFPFTTQRLEELENQNLSFFTDPPSMKELLGDSVISPHGVQVPSAHLENKIVGLVFPVGVPIIKSLLSAWEKLKDHHREFEIVVVYPPYHEFSSTHYGDPLPWSSLHDTSLCQKLWWIYHPPRPHGFLSNGEQESGVLVIIGPQRNRFCTYYAADILYKFGAEGYPFTLERTAELEKEKLMKLELSSLLGKEHFVCAADQKVTTVSKLLGKVVVLVSERPWHKVRDQILKKLNINLGRGSEILLRCISPEGCSINEGFTEGGEFPIVYISEDGATDVDYKTKDPVMLCPSKLAYLSCVSSGLLGFYYHAPQVAVFGQDGRLAAKLCWVEAEGDRKKEVLTCICDINRVLLSQLHDAYYTTDLVGWSNLEGVRKVSGIDYI